MVTPQLTVTHRDGEYPLYVEAGLLEVLPALAARHLGSRPTALICDATVARLYLDWLKGEPSPWRPRDSTCADQPPGGWPDPLTFEPGEASKSRRTWAMLTDQLLDRGLGRDGALVAMGGGVTGDLAGFVAATYLRGIPLVQVPTTLLAMLDSSVGGKVGVDTAHGKNLVGAFHPPAAVVADPMVLATLGDREFRSGLAEAVKHGLIADAGHLEWIEAEAAQLAARDLGTVTTLIRRSIAIKAGIVARDEREAGPRELLNAGHTVGHALEHAGGYQLLHGEAVAIGLVAECRIGEALGVTPTGTASRVATVLEALGLPVRTPNGVSLAAPDLLAAMGRDKKNRAGQLRMALPSAIGCGAGVDVPANAVASIDL